MFEHRRQPLLPRRIFYQRVANSVMPGLAIILISLGVGIAGYRFLEHMSWLDSFVNAAMILSGMGQSVRCKPTSASFLQAATRFSVGYPLLPV